MTIKDAKKNYVIDGACELFLKRSIPTVTIRDIALHTGVGEATVYRYFSGRSELIVACAMKLQTQVEKAFSGITAAKSGFEKLKRFFGVYLELFNKDPALYRFLNEFDAFCINEGALDLEKYADNLDRFKALFLSAYNEGISDGSVQKQKDIELFYYTTTHSILSLCKKLAVSGEMVRQDKLIDNSQEISTLFDIFLFSLKSRQ